MPFRPHRSLALTAVVAVVAYMSAVTAPAALEAAAAPAPAAAPAADELPATLFLAAPPAQPKPVSEVKKGASKGERVVVRGRIGGTRDPMVAGRAVFTIVDPALPVCGEKGPDQCKTPWDYCCEPRKLVAEKSATIQVLDAQGKPARQGLSGVRGLLPMAEVFVIGPVIETDNRVVLAVAAEGIWVAKLGRCELAPPSIQATPLAQAAGGARKGESLAFRATVEDSGSAFGRDRATVSVRDGDSRALVTVVDREGKPVEASLEGLNGLARGDQVEVVGTVVDVRDGVVHVQAERLWRAAANG